MATKYVVLQQDEKDKALWRELGSSEGGNDLAAIRTFLTTSGGSAGVYRAVPSRSWPKEPHDLKPKVSFV